MRELRVSLHLDEPLVVGVLAENNGRVFWEYDSTFVRSGLSLSPYSLPVVSGLHGHVAKSGVPLPGVFSDSRPDGWGLKLLHRSFAAAGRSRSTVTAFDELAWLGSRAMGALVYEPSNGPNALHQAVELGDLALHAREVYLGQTTETLPELIRAGGSPGGARPKVLIGRHGEEVCLGEGVLPSGFSPWMVKFARPEDDPECARRELAWMHLAETAGISVMESEVLDLGPAGEAFATRRFDRDEAKRVHMLSAAGALDVNFRTASADYRDLARLGALICDGDQRPAAALIRLAMFNVACVNEDDHLKNLAWLMDADGWRLAPGYDLTFSPTSSGHRSTTVLGVDREVSRQGLLDLATGAGLTVRRSVAMLDEVLAAVGTVGEVLADVGCENAVSRDAQRRVDDAIDRLS